MSQHAAILETARLRIRGWIESDRPLFREINSDPKVMEFFPHRRNDAEADALFDRINGSIQNTGLGFFALELKETCEPMGFCGLAPAVMPAIFPPETIEIGWRLATRYWGKGYVTEAANALLGHAFRNLELKAVLSFAVAENRRSTAVMERIGLKRVPMLDFDHPRVPDDQPRLKHHVVYAATREAWLAQETD